MQQALTMDVWHGRAQGGVPTPRRLWDAITLEQYRWAVGVVGADGVQDGVHRMVSTGWCMLSQVTTRALGVGDGAYLLPVIDMANHRAGSAHRVEVQEGAFVLRLGSNVAAGDEVGCVCVFRTSIYSRNCIHTSTDMH